MVLSVAHLDHVWQNYSIYIHTYISARMHTHTHTHTNRSSSMVLCGTQLWSWMAKLEYIHTHIHFCTHAHTNTQPHTHKQEFFDGLVWHSALVMNGKIRVNYYIEELFGNPEVAKDVWNSPMQVWMYVYIWICMYVCMYVCELLYWGAVWQSRGG
jgi:hypothetical protein